MRRIKINHKKGLTLLEVLITTSLLTVMIAGVYAALWTGQNSWFDAEASIDLQQNLRMALDKITRELNQSGINKDNVLQVAIDDGAGVNATDILRFSIPVICHNGDNLIDNNGDVVYWRAPLTWGCTDSACMDADDNCATVDYKSIEYLMNASRQLTRRALDNNNQVVKVDIFAYDISDFQVTRNGNVVTLNVALQKKSLLNRDFAASVQMDVLLRNQN